MRGIQWLLQHQTPSGDFPYEKIKGVFNATISISYNGYRQYFPIWAFGAYEVYCNRLLAAGSANSGSSLNSVTQMSRSDVPSSPSRRRNSRSPGRAQRK
jgi:hypothetical protein